MEVTFEVTVKMEGDTVYNKEFTVSDSDKEVIKAAVMAGINALQKNCKTEISTAIDEA